MSKETVYLAGKITGDPNYREKFAEAAQELETAGFIVLNPAMLPQEGFSWEAYMRISLAMLDECETVFFLPDWKDSRGATWEYGRAVATGKVTVIYKDWKYMRERAVKEPTEILEAQP